MTGDGDIKGYIAQRQGNGMWCYILKFREKRIKENKTDLQKQIGSFRTAFYGVTNRS